MSIILVKYVYVWLWCFCFLMFFSLYHIISYYVVMSIISLANHFVLTKFLNEIVSQTKHEHKYTLPSSLLYSVCSNRRHHSFFKTIVDITICGGVYRNNYGYCRPISKLLYSSSDRFFSFFATQLLTTVVVARSNSSIWFCCCCCESSVVFNNPKSPGYSRNKWKIIVSRNYDYYY